MRDWPGSKSRSRCSRGLPRRSNSTPSTAGPVDVVCLLLLPANTQGEQFNALACAARALRDPAAVSGVRRAADAAALYDALAKASAAASKHTTPAEPRAK
jgi:hypothetical protein